MRRSMHTRTARRTTLSARLADRCLGSVLCWLLLGALGSAGSVSAQGVPLELTKIEFEGNETFPDDSLAGAIFNRQTECRSFLLAPFCALGAGFSRDVRHLNERRLRGDIFRVVGYYSTRGYREAKVDTAIVRDDDEARIVFRVQEGRPVRIAEFSIIGVDGIDGIELGGLPVKEGDPLSRILLDVARDTLAARFRNNGYPAADVLLISRIQNDRPFEAQVTFDVDPGRPAAFGPVSLTGNSELSSGVILRMLPFSEGDVYSEALRLQGQRNLFGIELIQNASVAAAAVSDSIVPILVNVTEGDKHRVRTGGGWSTSDCVNAEGRWTSRNFFGGARQLQIRARLSNIAADDLSTACSQAGTGDFGGLNWLVSADFRQPWIFSGRFELNSSLFFERQSLQDVFVRQAVGFDARLTRSIGPFTRLTLYFRPELTELDAAEVFFCTSFLVCSPDDIRTLQGRNWLAPLGVNLVRDRTDDLLNPTRGYSFIVDYEHASAITGSNFGFNRVFSEASAYRPVGRDQVIAARVSGGWVGSGSFGLLQSSRDVVHPQKRFYLGGANSVRGFAQNQMGPRVLTVDARRLLFPEIEGADPACLPAEVIDLTCDASALPSGRLGAARPTGGRMMLQGNLEYRFPLGSSRWEGAAYLDVGKVFIESDRPNPSSFEASPGFGFRYLSPIGPLRLDLGYNFRGVERLQVVTSRIRPFDPGIDEEGDQISFEVPDGVGGSTRQTLPYVIVDELALLQEPVGFGDSPGFSLSRFQIHFSIGQAF